MSMGSLQPPGLTFVSGSGLFDLSRKISQNLSILEIIFGSNSRRLLSEKAWLTTRRLRACCALSRSVRVLAACRDNTS